MGGSRSVSVTLPEKLAFTGPTRATTLAVNSVSETFSTVSQPGMQALSVAGSLSFSHTAARGAGMRSSPCISMRMLPLLCVGQLCDLGDAIATEPMKIYIGFTVHPTVRSMKVWGQQPGDPPSLEHRRTARTEGGRRR